MKGNKGFIISMIATGVIGLIVLMVMMFFGVKYYLGGNHNNITIEENNIKQEEVISGVTYRSTTLIVITELLDDELKGFDINNSRAIIRPISRTTKISDAYGKTIPLSTIREGDIVEVVYEENKQRTVSISKSTCSWSKNEVSGVTILPETNQIKLFGVYYTYDQNIKIQAADGTEIKITDVNPCDIVTVQGIEDKVYSIRVEEAAGKINLIDIPDKNGRVEIDINKMIPLDKISGPIDVIPGTHKISVNIKGYEGFTQEIEVAAGETVEISLDSAKRIYSNVKVVLSNSDIQNYTIKIGNKTYNKGDKISIPQGTYTVVINALGYNTWTKNITFTKGDYTIKATLQSEKSEEEETTTTDNTVSTPTQDKNEVATGDTKTINIATDPAGATVYINGVNKGTTPYKVTLQLGSYSVLLEKEGHEIYSTSIILDGSDDQTSFLYVLTPQS